MAYFTQIQIKAKLTFSPNIVLEIKLWTGKIKEDVGELHKQTVICKGEIYYQYYSILWPILFVNYL
jgi:hypothetical protein